MPTSQKQCRTFNSLSDFRTFQHSPASRTASGESAGPHSDLRGNGGVGVPPWRAELLRRPLRRVVSWETFTIPAWRRLPECQMYRERLECGHKSERMVSVDPPAKRRRCRECGRKEQP